MKVTQASRKDPSMSPQPTPTVQPPAEHPVSPGGVMYVGPSLTRSLLGVAVALSRGSA